MFIGQNLRRQRLIKGWSQEALGKSAGPLSQGTISLLESNKQEASWEQICLLAKALNISTNLLILTDSGDQAAVSGMVQDSFDSGEILALKERIKEQAEEIAFLRGLVQRHLAK